MTYPSKSVIALLVLLISVVVPFSALAQDEPVTIIDGLNNPRGIFIGEGGTLYVTEAGTGGDIPTVGVFGPDSPTNAGSTGTVLAILPDGTVRTTLYGFPSLNMGGEVVGLSDILIAGDTIWLATAQGPVPGQGNADNPFTYAVIGIDSTTMRIRHFIDLYAFEQENNPDGDIIDSQPVDVAVSEDGVVYIADAGANAVLQWSEADGISLFATWEDNPVPTTVAVTPEGNLLIGFLMGFPFPTDGSRIEPWSLDGELITTYTGLTSVVDVQVEDDGTIYAVEFARFGDLGWEPASGRVVTVSEAGVLPLMENLNFPYGLALGANGEKALVLGSSGEPGSGSVIGVGMSMPEVSESSGTEASEPASTPEVSSGG